MRWLRPQDEFMLNSSTHANPQQIGAVLWLAVPVDEPGPVAEGVLGHLRARIPSTALAAQLESTPFELAPSWWRRLGAVDVSRHFRVLDGPISRDDLRELVAREMMVPVDVTGPPFRGVVVERVDGGGAAVLLFVHHALVDGVGFQRIIAALTDPAPTSASGTLRRQRDEWRPPTVVHLGRAAHYLASQALERRRRVEEVADARHALDAFDREPENQQPRAPELRSSGPSSPRRSYDMTSLSLTTIAEIRRSLGGSVNDVFLTVAGGALRSFLLDAGELPATPLVALAARGYRKAHHGDLGNFILSLQPHIGTHLEDPVTRFRAVQESAALAIRRSHLVEPMAETADKPFGSRDRRRRLETKAAGSNSVFGANVTLSSVPGPDRPVYLAGYRVEANYPTPLVGSGRFLNLTLRRYCDALDVGVMTDAARVPDASVISAYLASALGELAEAARTTNA